MRSLCRITIAVPTYNRSEFLKQCLEEHRYLFEDRNCSIVISDNASEDGTRFVLDAQSKEYPNIRYYRNQETVLGDDNFEKVLRYADTDYVWLLGDTYLIPEETFIGVQTAIAEDDYDVIVVNVAKRVTDVQEQVYTDRNKLLADIGWHMTCIGSVVYSRRLLTEANFVRYRDTNFLQTGIIFEYLADRSLKVKWLPQYSVKGLKIPGVKKTSWEAQTFAIWTKRWANFVFSLPASYSLDSKLQCVMDHGLKSGVFTLSALKRLRKKKILDVEVCRQYAAYFPMTISYPSVLIRLIATLPSWLFRVF